eukprot:gene28055-36943_t
MVFENPPLGFSDIAVAKDAANEFLAGRIQVIKGNIVIAKKANVAIYKAILDTDGESGVFGSYVFDDKSIQRINEISRTNGKCNVATFNEEAEAVAEENDEGKFGSSNISPDRVSGLSTADNHIFSQSSPVYMATSEASSVHDIDNGSVGSSRDSSPVSINSSDWRSASIALGGKRTFEEMDREYRSVLNNSNISPEVQSQLLALYEERYESQNDPSQQSFNGPRTCSLRTSSTFSQIRIPVRRSALTVDAEFNLKLTSSDISPDVQSKLLTLWEQQHRSQSVMSIIWKPTIFPYGKLLAERQRDQSPTKPALAAAMAEEATTAADNDALENLLLASELKNIKIVDVSPPLLSAPAAAAAGFIEE